MTGRHILTGLAACLSAGILLWSPLQAQSTRTPTARLVSASRFDLPGEVDSSNPMVWSLVDGVNRLFVLTSWGGVPVRSSGATLETLQHGAPVAFSSHPGNGVWMEAIIPDEAGTWYGYYHHERPADQCGRPDRQLPRLGAMRSSDQGATWEDLGMILDAPPGSEACDSANRFVLGGVGDVTVVLDANGQDLYLYFSQYLREPSLQGVAVARMAWADRDAPEGKATVWNDGAWLPASRVDDAAPFTYPSGTPLVTASRPFHDRSAVNDVFWGASIHWNTYLEQYVMLLNRAKDDQFGQEGIYVSFAPGVSDPRAWSTPTRIMTGGQWYPQAAGIEPGTGTDKIAGRRARFFMTGKSERMIEFEK